LKPTQPLAIANHPIWMANGSATNGTKTDFVHFVAISLSLGKAEARI
jgi:hypothetical protein